jgi:hypothetical protein
MIGALSRRFTKTQAIDEASKLRHRVQDDSGLCWGRLKKMPIVAGPVATATLAP